MTAPTGGTESPAAAMIRTMWSGPATHRLAVAAFMAVSIASAIFGASGYDTARDVAEAYAIRHGQSFPLHGPLLGGAVHLGPLWFYLLALPLAVHESWLAVALFVAALCSLQFPLAYAAGRRLLDRRFGLLWCAMLALPGWGTFALVGFGHVSAVGVTTLLVVYALVRLAQERRPAWLALAAFAWMLALHAHPATAPLALPIAVVAARTLRDRGALARWGLIAAAVAALPLAPLALEHWTSPAVAPERPGDYVAGSVHLANLANVPALLYGVLVRGPRVIANAFFAWLPGLPGLVLGIVVALEAIALAGLAAACTARRALCAAALALVAVVAVATAVARPATPFYLTFALLTPLAGALALGLHRGCALAGARAPLAAAAFAAMLLALHAGSAVGIARAIVSGSVAMPVAPRLDVKRDDAVPPRGELWLPAYAVGESGRFLCARTTPVVVHGTYAYLEDAYFGLDYRLVCGARDVRLLGAAPARGTPVVGLARPLWAALGWRPAHAFAGLGVAPVASVIAPRTGRAVPDGLTYPPYTIPAGPARPQRLAATLAGDVALVVSFPFATWLPEPALRVTADGQAMAPLARDAVSAVYACRACSATGSTSWSIEFETAAPEWIDLIGIVAPR
jgi:hypothetical protein